MYCALTAVGAFIKVPLGEVPFTLQTLFVMLSGSLLGARYGALSQLEYLILGLVGLPIFAYGGGPGYVFNPSFGYLAGFVPAAWIIGKLIEKHENPSIIWIFLANIVGVIVIFSIGIPVLYLNLKYLLNKTVKFSALIWSGGLIFLPGSLIKAAICALLVSKLKKYHLVTRRGEELFSS